MVSSNKENEEERYVTGTPNHTHVANRAFTSAMETDEVRHVFQRSPEPTLPVMSRSLEKFCIQKDGEVEYADGRGKNVHVFSRTAISEELAIGLKDSAAFLDMKIQGNRFRAIGAASLLVYPHQEETKTVLVTAKHNVLKDTVDNVEIYTSLLTTQQGYKCQVFDGITFETDARKDGPVDLRLNTDGEMWKWDYGMDVLCLSAKFVGNQIPQVLKPFTLAPLDFELAVGHKIGIVIWNDEGARPDKVESSEPMDYGQVKNNYGSRQDVNLYTGEIKLVGERHIEHDINTYSGCSGALIFLLDLLQPDTVAEADYGKVVAIHVGSKEGMDYNVGMKLVGDGREALLPFRTDGI